MTLNEYREAIIKAIKAFIRKYRPSVIDFRFPLTMKVTVQERQHPHWRKKTCKTCRYRLNISDGKWKDGDDRFHCVGLGFLNCVANRTPACPKYED